MSLVVEPAFAELFERAGLRTFDDVAALPAQRVARDVPGRRTFSVMIGDTPGWVKLAEGGGEVTREYDMLRLMRGMDLPVPEPMAKGTCGGRSLVVIGDLTGAEQGDHYLERQAAELPPVEWTRLKRAAIRRIAAVARDFHAHRLHHRDFYLCHFWLEPVGGGDVRAFLMDHHRTGHRPFFWRRWLVKDLAQLHFSCFPRLFTRTDRMRFLRVYLGKRRLDRADKRLIAAVRRKARRIAAHAPRHDRVHTEHGEELADGP